MHLDYVHNPLLPSRYHPNIVKLQCQLSCARVGHVSPTPQLGRGRTRHARGLCARLTPRAAGSPPPPPLPGPGPGRSGCAASGPRFIIWRGGTPSVGRKAGMSPTCSQRARPGAARCARPAHAPTVAHGLARHWSPLQGGGVHAALWRPAPPDGRGCGSPPRRPTPRPPVLGRGCGVIRSLATCPRPHPDRHAAPVRLRPQLLVALAAAVRLMVAHRPNGLARLRCACAPGGPLWSVALRDTSRRGVAAGNSHPPPVATLCARPPLASGYPIRPARQGYALPFGP